MVIFLHFPPPMPKLPRFGSLSSYFPASFWVFFFTFRLIYPNTPASAYSLLTFRLLFGYFSSPSALYTQTPPLRLTLFLLSGFFLVFFFTFYLIYPSCPASAYSLLTFRLLFGYFLHFPPYIPKHPCFGIFRSAFRLIYCVLVCHITQHFPFQNSATSCGTSLSLHSL